MTKFPVGEAGWMGLWGAGGWGVGGGGGLVESAEGLH